MKKIILLTLMIGSSFIYSQGLPVGPAIGIQNALDGNLLNFYGINNSRIDYARIVIPEKHPEIEGTVYAYKEWNNRGLLNVDGKNYKLNNLNFNMYTNTIEAKVGKDSVYIFDLANVDHAYINNKKFKSLYVSENRQNTIFEMIYDGDDFQMLKMQEVLIVKAEVDPLMVKNKKARFKLTTNYYIKRGNYIEKIILKKKSISKLFKDKNTLVNSFVKENKLSYKKGEDLKKMFAYYSSL